VEFRVAEIAGMTEELHAEVHQRLNFVEDHLRFRVSKAETNLVDAEVLFGIQDMSQPAMKDALVEASAVCRPRLLSPTS
jgi:hypothetical protein